MTDAISPIFTETPDAAGVLRRRVRAVWASRGLWALVDQATLSAGNFLTNFVLIRRWASVDYGRYGLLLTFILFLNNLHMALVTYPLSISHWGTDGDLRRRSRRALVMTLGLGVPFGIVLATAASFRSTPDVVVVVVATLVVWQLQETVRRTLMARLQHHRAVLGDFVSYLVQAGLIAALCWKGTPTLVSVFLIVGVTAVAGLLIQAYQLRLFTREIETLPPDPGWPALIAEHWSLGKWLLLINLINVVTVYGAPWLLNLTHGSSEFARLAAVMLLLNAGNPVLTSIAGLITPAVARHVSLGDPRAARTAAVTYAAQGAALLFPFYGVLLVVPHFALTHFFGKHSPYLVLATPLRLMAASYGVLYLSAMINSYLCGLGKSRMPFYGSAMGAVVTAAITLPLAARHGVNGAAAGALFPAVAQLAAGVYFLLKIRTTKFE